MICKKEKNSIMCDAVARRCSAKTFSWKIHKIHIEIRVLESISYTVKDLEAVGLQLVDSLQNLKENTCVGVSF